MGDKVDNVPDRKCGPKTAAKWVNEIGGIDAIKAHAHEVTGKIGENLRKGLSFLDEAVKLVTIDATAWCPGRKRPKTSPSARPTTRRSPRSRTAGDVPRGGWTARWRRPAKRLLKAAPPAQPVLTEGLFAGLGEDQPAAPAASVVSAVPTAAAAPPTRPSAWCRPRSARPKRSCARSRTMRRTPAETPTRSSLKSSTPPIALEALRTKLTDPARLHEAPVALTLLWEGETRAAVMKGVAVALSPLDVHVWTADMEVTAKELSSARRLDGIRRP